MWQFNQSVQQTLSIKRGGKGEKERELDICKTFTISALWMKLPDNFLKINQIINAKIF